MYGVTIVAVVGTRQIVLIDFVLLSCSVRAAFVALTCMCALCMLSCYSNICYNTDACLGASDLFDRGKTLTFGKES